MKFKLFRFIWCIPLLALTAAQSGPLVPQSQSGTPSAGWRRDGAVNVEFLGKIGPLRDLAPAKPGPFTSPPRVLNNLPRPTFHAGGPQQGPVIDNALQTEYPQATEASSIVVNYPSTARVEPVYPPDPSMDIGPNHFISLVNLHFQIFDRSGSSLVGPNTTNTLWGSGQCAVNNDGDGVVLYDQLADRWLIGQFSVTNGNSAGFYYCLAVSQTADPTGAWYAYAINFGNTTFIDYPKIGVWPDGYYFTANTYNVAGTSWTGTEACAFQRSAMLTGSAATAQCWANGKQPPTDYYSLLPADLDGYTPPAAGEPEHFAQFYSSTRYDILDMSIDWVTPANSTFSLVKSLTTNTFTYLCLSTRSCIPQQGTTTALDGIGDRLMFRLPYRVFNGWSSMVMNNSVQVGTSPTRAGIRWYELRNSVTPYSPANWTVYQQSTFDPGGGLSRWMGSIAMNKFGDIALGYSTSGPSAYPGISFTGRLEADPLSTMTLGETQIQAGAASQTIGNRWGDYTQMVVDPLDDCTFWYTNEYLTSGQVYWSMTRTAAFRLNTTTCTGFGTSVVLTDLSVTSRMGTAVVNWTSVNELNLLGFKLYRAQVPGGLPQEIASLAAKYKGQIQGTTYEYVDTQVSPGETYSYTLDALTNSGTSEHFVIGTVTIDWVDFLPLVRK